MSSSANECDLSPYERARLANIERNRALLQQLGLAESTSIGLKTEVSIKNSLAASFSPATVRKPKRVGRTIVEAQCLRRSSRVLNAASSSSRGNTAAAADHVIQNIDFESTHDAVPELDYSDNEILLPEQLDDHEFELYTMLRAWRLSVCRPLELEPYKVFQNRTLVEAVRRRRSDGSWGTTQQQLLECWGIGPVKVRLSSAPPSHVPPHAS
jgi:hypothetical protein